MSEIGRKKVVRREVTGERQEVPVADPAEQAERHEEIHWAVAMVQSALEALRPNLGDLNVEIVERRIFKNEAVAIVAAALNLSSDQIRARQHRALEKLRRHLGLVQGLPLGALSDLDIVRNAEA